MEGIQESKEVLKALNLLAVDLVKVFKKHSGVADIAAALLGDEELKAALLAAYDGVSKVPAELKDLDFSEVLELGMEQAKSVPALLAALKS